MSCSTDDSIPTPALRANHSQVPSHGLSQERPVETVLQHTSPAAFYFVTGAHAPTGQQGERAVVGKGLLTAKYCPPGPGNPQQASLPPACQRGLSRLGSSRSSPTLCPPSATVSGCTDGSLICRLLSHFTPVWLAGRAEQSYCLALNRPAGRPRRELSQGPTPMGRGAADRSSRKPGRAGLSGLTKLPQGGARCPSPRALPRTKAREASLGQLGW